MPSISNKNDQEHLVSIDSNINCNWFFKGYWIKNGAGYLSSPLFLEEVK